HVIQFEKYCPFIYISKRKLNTLPISCAKLFQKLFTKFQFNFTETLTSLKPISFTSH
uniref:Uncharacterized protein n=1 Tax=Macaca fascicularis TaxID=9541 RepID=A0A7N9D9Z4_MACFA